MVPVSVTIVLFCVFVHLKPVVSRSKMREIESKLNLLQNKFTMLENKVFRDELEFRDDIDTILRELNNTYNDDTGKSSDVNQASTETKREFEAMARINAIRDGFEFEKRYIRHRLKVFGSEFNEMQQMAKRAIAELFVKAEEKMIEMNKKLSDGSAYMNDIREEMENKIDSVEQNFTNKVQVDDISWHKMRLAIDELRQNVSGSSSIFNDIQDKVKQMRLTVDLISDKLFFECGSWAKFGMSCYKVFHETVSWEDAVRNCRAQEAYLVEIESSDEHTFLRNLFTYNKTNIRYSPSRYVAPPPGPWLGASDRYSEGKWVWDHSRRYITYDNWAYGEPNGRKKENCVYMNGFVTYSWRDSSCDEKKPYICEKSFK